MKGGSASPNGPSAAELEEDPVIRKFRITAATAWYTARLAPQTSGSGQKPRVSLYERVRALSRMAKIEFACGVDCRATGWRRPTEMPRWFTYLGDFFVGVLVLGGGGQTPGTPPRPTGSRALLAVDTGAAHGEKRRPAEMSECQYYEFQAIDRPLTARQP